MKPTAGPWEIDGDSQRIDGIGMVRMYRVLAPNGSVVAEFSNAGCNEIIYEDDGEYGGSHCDIQAMANAKLIAAAPDMAEAIAALIETYEPYPGGDAWDAYQKAKAALAKACGEFSTIKAAPMEITPEMEAAQTKRITDALSSISRDVDELLALARQYRKRHALSAVAGKPWTAH